MVSYYVIGGDERMSYLADLLKKNGKVETACMEHVRTECTDPALILQTARNAENIILPIPYTKDDIHIYTPLSDVQVRLCDVMERLHASQNVYAGIPKRTNAVQTQARVINFLENEQYAGNNARLTAEVVLGLIISKYRLSPFRKRVLVLGAGRIAKLLARQLSAFCAQVTIAARKDADVAMAAAQGYGAIHICELAAHMQRFEIIINTVPAQIVGSSELQAMKESALLIDIASRPFGVDSEALKTLNKNAVSEQGLPGKYMAGPEAEALFRVVCESELGG